MKDFTKPGAAQPVSVTCRGGLDTVIGMEQGAVLAGRYRLDARLGGGGMGEVWEGVDQVLGRRVAVKLIRAELRDHAPSAREMLARFRREGEAAARLNHRNITTVHDFGEHQEIDHAGRVRVSPFLVLEFLEGRALASLMTRTPEEGLPINQLLEYGIQTCDGLAAAHAAGVVHRDIKPANLMLLADGTVKICDFGIARLSEATPGLTGYGVAVGTLAYMAPEQRQGLPVDHRADLFAFGATLYRLLTGGVRTAQPPSTHRSDISKDLDDIIGSLLSEDPDQRPASASEVSNRLRDLSSTRPAPATRREGSRQSGSFSRRPTHTLLGHTGSVSSVAFAPQSVDGRILLASGSSDEAVRLWNAATGEPTGQVLTGHTYGVLSVAFAPQPISGRLALASGSSDKAVRLWDAATGETIGTPLTGHPGWVVSVAFAPQPVDGRLLLAAGVGDGPVRLWDVVAARKPFGEPLNSHVTGTAPRRIAEWTKRMNPMGTWVHPVAFAPRPVDGRLLLASGRDGEKVQLWDAGTGKPVGRPLTGHTQRVRSVAFAPQPVDGQLLLATGSMDGEVRLWNAGTGEPVGRPLTGHESPVLSVTFAPQSVDGRVLLAVGSGDGVVRVWEV
ncbi:WD40 repeat domain-containing serine/threonine protein kinase [Actinomadura sp. LOL_016]|uniref:WD40 repeat domain-containing serine/threonine protein kinase n=1 Tax=unclassified Actinomadura TaxID=2626254 RepID=UPI003A80E924